MNKFAWAVAVVAAASLALMTGCNKGSENSDNSGGGGTKVGVVDLDHVLRETHVQEKFDANLKAAQEFADESLKGTKKTLEEKGIAIQRELAPKQEAWEKQVREDIASRKPPTSMPAEVATLRNKLSNLQVIMNAALQAKREQVQAYANDTRAKFRMDIQPILSELAKTKGVAVIIDKNSTFFADADTNLDAALVNKISDKGAPELKAVPKDDLLKQVDITEVLKRIGVE